MGTLDRDGVGLHYEEIGSGDPPFVFVHGWCCNHTYFAPQIEQFSKSHRVVAIDLRGHGASDKPEQDYTVTGFADDVAWMCRELNIDKPVLIGHSMGGITLWELAGRFPDVPRAIVMVDPAAIIPAPGFRDAVAPVAEGLRTEDYRDVQRTLLESFLFVPTDDSAVKARIIEEMGSAPQHVMASSFSDMALTWDGAAHGEIRVTALMILAGESMSDLERVKQLCPGLQIGRTVGAGHFHQLLVPDQINAMISRFIKCLTFAASPA